MTTSTALAAPDFHTSPAYSRTLGPLVGRLAARVGFAPYPEQQLLLDDTFALDPKNPDRMASFDIGVVGARQQLKTGFLKMTALGWLFITEEELIIWSAHEFSTSKEAFGDMMALIARSPELSRRVRYRGGAVPEIQVLDPDGGAKPKSILRFKARTNSGGGRGLTGSKVILDEAFNLEAEMVGAMLPTMISRPKGQVVYASSAGMARSVILRSIRDRGRAGWTRMAYAEWLAARKDCEQPTCQHAVGTPGCALDDVALWRKACPITDRKDHEEMQAIRDLRNSPAMPPEMFMRECLGWWDEPLGDSPIPETVWTPLTDPTSTASEWTVVLEVTPERDWACIVAAGMSPSGRVHVEITQNSATGEFDHRPGTAWVVDRLVPVLNGNPLYIAAGSAAESLVPDLQKAGIWVIRIPTKDIPAACGRFYDLAMSAQLAHTGQTDLAAAVTSARQKFLGDKTFTWVRPSGVSDISAMYGATLAAWVASGFGGISAG